MRRIFAIWADQKLAKRRVRKFDRVAFVIFQFAEPQIGVIELPKGVASRARHFALHRQQSFFVVRQRVRPVAKQSLELQTKTGERRIGDQLRHFGFVDRQ